MGAIMKFGVLVIGMLFFSCCSSIHNNNLNGILWVQTSSEYKANSIQVFNSAAARLDYALFDKNWSAAIEQENNYSSLPEAIVMDVDETVLDNSSYQAELILQHSKYDGETWDSWISSRDAEVIPGAISFINEAKNMGIEIIFITNRECKLRENDSSPCPQEMDTIINLSKVGIAGVKPENIYLKNEKEGWSSEKKSRRKIVAEKYRIIMLFGDDLSDFLPDLQKVSEQRAKLVLDYSKNWGTKWFVLSNPIYGSWLQVLDSPRSQYLRGY
jgi:acid phosphatase